MKHSHCLPGLFGHAFPVRRDASTFLDTLVSIFAREGIRCACEIAQRIDWLVIGEGNDDGTS